MVYQSPAPLFWPKGRYCYPLPGENVFFSQNHRFWHDDIDGSDEICEKNDKITNDVMVLMNIDLAKSTFLDGCDDFDDMPLSRPDAGSHATGNLGW